MIWAGQHKTSIQVPPLAMPALSSADHRKRSRAAAERAPPACPDSSGLEGAESGTEGLYRLAQPGGCRPGDLSLRLMLVVGLDKLLILLLDLLGVLARRAEQQLLQMAEQVLPGLLGRPARRPPRPARRR